MLNKDFGWEKFGYKYTNENAIAKNINKEKYLSELKKFEEPSLKILGKPDKRLICGNNESVLYQTDGNYHEIKIVEDTLEKQVFDGEISFDEAIDSRTDNEFRDKLKKIESLREYFTVIDIENDLNTVITSYYLVRGYVPNEKQMLKDIKSRVKEILRDLNEDLKKLSNIFSSIDGNASKANNIDSRTDKSSVFNSSMAEIKETNNNDLEMIKKKLITNYILNSDLSQNYIEEIKFLLFNLFEYRTQVLTSYYCTMVEIGKNKLPDEAKQIFLNMVKDYKEQLILWNENKKA